MPPSGNGPPHAIADVSSGIPPLSFHPPLSEQGHRDLLLGGAGEITVERPQHERQAGRCERFGAGRASVETAPRESIEGSDRGQPRPSDIVRDREFDQQVGCVEETGAGNRELNPFPSLT